MYLWAVVRWSKFVKDLKNSPIEWRVIVNFPEYQVSNTGRVRRGTIHYAKQKKYSVGYEVQLRQNKAGHVTCVLRDANKRQRTLLVYRLVCVAFHGPPPETHPYVLHRNGIRDDNRPANLTWATPEEHKLDMRHRGVALEGERHGRAKLTVEDVRAIRLRIQNGENRTAIARSYGVSFTLIYKIAARELWRNIN